MSATISPINTTRKAKRIEEDLHHQKNAPQDETQGHITVNNKPDMVLKTAIEPITTTIGIRIDPIAIREHEGMIIGDVTLIMTIRTENKMTMVEGMTEISRTEMIMAIKDLMKS